MNETVFLKSSGQMCFFNPDEKSFFEIDKSRIFLDFRFEALKRISQVEFKAQVEKLSCIS